MQRLWNIGIASPGGTPYEIILVPKAVRRDPAVGSDRVPEMATFVRLLIHAGSQVPRSHCRCPAAAGEGTWRNMAKWFSGVEFARPGNAMRSSFSVPAVTAANGIAASPAEGEPAWTSTVAPTAAIRAARKDGRIIATGKRGIVNAERHRA